jgi:uncharacterized membrane protein YvlD (DUF360 family)
MTATLARLPAPELPEGPRSALVIATTTYDDPVFRQLRAPATDAVDLADLLADPRIGAFEVTSVVDRSAQEVRIAIENFLAGRMPADLVVIYLSCHGVTDARGNLHFAATDTFNSLVASTGIAATWVNDRLEECRARGQILILDCCFSGAFARGAKGAEALGLNQLTEPGRGRAVLTASRATEYSFETPTSAQPIPDSPASGSIFTAALLAGLRDGSADRNGDGFVTVDEAYGYAYQQVRASGAAQNPQLWLSGGEGELLLARSPAGRVIVPADLPDSLRAALDSQWPTVRVGAVQGLRGWLASDDPARVVTAIRELEGVADNDMPQVAEAARSALRESCPPGVPRVSTGSSPADDYLTSSVPLKRTPSPGLNPAGAPPKPSPSTFQPPPRHILEIPPRQARPASTSEADSWLTTSRPAVTFFRLLMNAAALAIAVWILSGISLTGSGMMSKIITFLIMALIFGILNAMTKPIFALFTAPLLLLTLGLFLIVLNVCMLLLTSWLAGLLDLGWHVDGFWTAVLGAIIISIVSFILNVYLPDPDDRRRG